MDNPTMCHARVPPWRLREVSDNDHAWLFELHRVAMGEYIEQTWGWDEALQQQLFAHAFDRLRGQIIQVDNQDVGLLVVEEKTDELYLLRLVLLPEAQNQGLGTDIVRGLLRRAADTGRPLSLHVLKANPRAAALYAREGLKAVGADDVRVLMRTES
jgi:ribosomal protein S18 acetylase RimI-like enzyme